MKKEIGKINYETFKATDLSLLKIESAIDFAMINTIINDEIIPKCIYLNEAGIPDINIVHVEMLKRIFILGNLTNFKIPETLDGEKIVEISDWSNKFWDRIIKKIKNYDLFENLLDKAIEFEISKKSRIEYKLMDIIETFTKKIREFDIEKTIKNIDPKLVSQLKNIIPKDIIPSN